MQSVFTQKTRLHLKRLGLIVFALAGITLFLGIFSFLFLFVTHDIRKMVRNDQKDFNETFLFTFDQRPQGFYKGTYGLVVRSVSNKTMNSLIEKVTSSDFRSQKQLDYSDELVYQKLQKSLGEETISQVDQEHLSADIYHLWDQQLLEEQVLEEVISAIEENQRLNPGEKEHTDELLRLLSEESSHKFLVEYTVFITSLEDNEITPSEHYHLQILDDETNRIYQYRLRKIS